MNYTILKFVSVLVVTCVLSLAGLAQAQLVEHAWHHAHHQAATHGTVLCSWMCAAGTAVDDSVAPSLVERSPFTVSDNATFTFIPHIPLESATSRGPPSHSTI